MTNKLWEGVALMFILGVLMWLITYVCFGIDWSERRHIPDNQQSVLAGELK